MGIFSKSFGKKEKSIPLESKKERLEDFFKIDIKDIFKYCPEYTHTEISATGNEVKHYCLLLKELELGIFFDMEILQVAENEYTLIFKGMDNGITDDLFEFLEFYTNKYGLDEMGCGRIEQADYQYVASHSFSRLWKNLMIDNNVFNGSNGNMEMSIMGIKTI